jgi:hypothetical protein
MAGLDAVGATVRKKGALGKLRGIDERLATEGRSTVTS